jgi:hypothetical protein
MRILIQKKAETSYMNSGPILEVIVEEVTDDETYVKFKDPDSGKYFWEKIATIRSTTSYTRVKTLGLPCFMQEVPKKGDKGAKSF